METAITNKYPLWEVGEDETISEAVKRVDELALLAEDWDGFDAPAISPVAIAAAKNFVNQSVPEIRRVVLWKEPSVSPMPDGGVYFHWYGSPIKFSLMFAPGMGGVTLLVGTGVGRAQRSEPAPSELPGIIAGLLAQQTEYSEAHQNGE